MKQALKGLCAAPLLALAAVLCVASAMASPAPTVKIEKVLADNTHYGALTAPNLAGSATFAVAMEKTDGLAPQTAAANAENTQVNAPNEMATSPTGFKEKGTALAVKIVLNAGSSNSILGANTTYATAAPPTSANVSNLSMANTGNTAADLSAAVSMNGVTGTSTFVSTTAPPTAVDASIALTENSSAVSNTS